MLVHKVEKAPKEPKETLVLRDQPELKGPKVI